MTYEIRNYDGTKLLDLGDGLSDSLATSLTFVGKNVTNFGKSQNENFLHLLENFAGLTEPVNKIKGQLWYDTSEYKLKFYNNGTWDALNVLDYTSTKPQGGRQGYLWFDSANKQLYVNTGSDYSFVGPERVEGFGITRLVSTKITDNTYFSYQHPVINITINDEVVGIISTGSFTASSGEYAPGFTNIQRGINLKNQGSTFPIIGRTFFSNTATTALNLLNGDVGSIPYQSNVDSTTFLPMSDNAVLYANGTTPEWKSLDNIQVSNATTSTNLDGGVKGSIVIQTAHGTTGFVPLGTDGYILSADGALQGTGKPKWVNPLDIGVATANTSTNSLHLLNGAGNSYISASTSSVASTIVERDANSEVRASAFIGNLQGNSDSTTKLATGRSIGLTGAVTGSAKFDGTEDISINVEPIPVLPTGIITLWYGSLLDIPNGWVLCDGRNNTPDLRDRFVMGAGGLHDPRSNGGSTDVTIGLNHMPMHQHSISESSHNHLFPGDDQLSFANGAGGWTNRSVAGFGYDATSEGGGGGRIWVTTDAKTGITTTNAEGDGDPMEIMPPYYALAYIMKL